MSRHSSATNRVALHRDGPVVLAATDDGHLIVHDIGFAARLPEEENAYRIAAERLAVNPSDSSARLARVRWFAFRGEWARALHAIRAVEPDAQDPERLLEVAIYKLLAGSTLTAYSWVCRCTGLHGISELRARAVRRAAADAFGSMCRARQRPGALPDILTVIPGLAAERDRRGWVALHHAAFGGHVSAIETLLRYGDDVDIRTNDAGKATALIIASELANTSIIRTLLQAGANPNATTSSGHTALHCAALAASEEGVLELLRARADVRALAVNNDTALHLAAERGDGRLISLLLDAGADAQGRNDRGELPTDVALRRRNEHAWIALTYRDGGPGL